MEANAGRVGAVGSSEDGEGRAGGWRSGHVLERAGGDDRRGDRQRRCTGIQIGSDDELSEHTG